MANSEGFRLNFLSSTNPENVRSSTIGTGNINNIVLCVFSAKHYYSQNRKGDSKIGFQSGCRIATIPQTMTF